MRKVVSVVWRFFDRVEKGGRCVAVLCKLCGKQYKFFGNTTNLKTHLVNKHPIQWDLTQDGTLDESALRYDEDSNQSTSRRKRSINNYRDKNVDVLDNDTEAETDNNDDNEATVTLVREMHDGEEWLEDQFQTNHVETYEPRRKKTKLRQVKREKETPPRRISTYLTPTPVERIQFDDVQRRDEYSVFGDYIANKLRKFSTSKTRGNLQQLITTILWQAEYGMYDNPEAVKRVIMYSIQDPQPEQSTSNAPDQESYHIHCEEIIVQRKDDSNPSNDFSS